MILSEMVLTFVNEKYFALIEQNQNTISLQTRMDIAIFVGFYYAKGTTMSCKMINLLLFDITSCFFRDCQISCESNDAKALDQHLYDVLAEKHREIKVKRQSASGADPAIRLLLRMYAKTNYSPIPQLKRSYRDQIATLINFLTQLKISTTLIMDSLDESSFFFGKNDPTLHTLQVFVDSVTNDDVLHLALGNWGEGAALSNSFSFFILLPEINNIPINISWTRRDKIPVINLQWTTLQLVSYVDHVFDYLRTKTHNQCKLLPNISSLLGGQKACMNTMKELRHPRDFHIFFDTLVQYMKSVCTQRDPPFIATKEDLEYVLSQTKLNILNE